MEILKPHPKLEAAILSCLVVSLICFLAFLIYSKSVDVLEKEIKIGLLSNVSAAATTIDGDLHKTFDQSTARDDPDYLSAITPLEQIRQAATNVRYIYTNILIGDDVFFILNPSPQNDNDGDGQPDEPPALMERYDDAAPELIEALKFQKKVVSDPYTDKWGTFISAYAPFYDAKGDFVGVLGMDLQLDDFYKRIHPIRQAFEKTAFIVVFIGLIIGLLTWLSRKHTAFLSHQNEDLRSEKAKRKGQLDAVKQSFIHLLEYLTGKSGAGGNNAESMAQSWLRYLRRSVQKSFNPQNFAFEEFVADLKAQSANAVSFKISTEGDIPNVVSGDKNALKDMITALVDHIRSMVEQGAVELDIKLVEERVDSLILSFDFAGSNGKLETSALGESLKPDLSRAEDYSEQELRFFSAIATAKAMGGTAGWLNEGEKSSLYLELPINKYQEDTTREAA
nr:PDC sensor domain-containing protein [uncultured Cohaesibacter sp.]